MIVRRSLDVLAATLAACLFAGPVHGDERLRVCADPNNLPFSNAAGEGFENALAELLAGELGVDVAYTWWPQRRGFIRNTLGAGTCDLVMGVPEDYELVETTRPYYRSTYVFVYRQARAPGLQSLLDPRLRELTIGVHLTGDDGANPPPAHALGQLGIVDNVVGYMIYGDYRQANPPARLIDAVIRDDIDVAAAWGPVGGYFARRSEVPLEVRAITDTASAPLPFEFSIAMGVRRGDVQLRDRVDAILSSRRDEVRTILRAWDLPLMDGESGEDRPAVAHATDGRQAPRQAAGE